MFENTEGQTIPGKEKGVQFVVVRHVPEYTLNLENKLPSGVYTQCKGFFRSVCTVMAVKQTTSRKHFFGKKVISEYGRFNLFEETEFRYSTKNVYNEPSLLIKFPKSFEYKVGNLIDNRIVLSVEYISLLEFKVNFSKVLGGDDLNIYLGKRGLPGYEDLDTFGRISILGYKQKLLHWRTDFFRNLSTDKEVIFSTLDFKPIERVEKKVA